MSKSNLNLVIFADFRDGQVHTRVRPQGKPALSRHQLAKRAKSSYVREAESSNASTHPIRAAHLRQAAPTQRPVAARTSPRIVRLFHSESSEMVDIAYSLSYVGLKIDLATRVTSEYGLENCERTRASNSELCETKNE